MKICKSCEVDHDNRLIITLTFKIKNFNLILSSDSLAKINWIKFVNDDFYEICEELTDSYNSCIKIYKRYNTLYIEANSESGYAFELEIPFGDISEEFIKLDHWYKSIIELFFKEN